MCDGCSSTISYLHLQMLNLCFCQVEFLKKDPQLLIKGIVFTKNILEDHWVMVFVACK